MIWTFLFVSFGANLTHFDAKPDISGFHRLLNSLLSTTYTVISYLAHFWPEWYQVQQILGPKVGIGVGVGEYDNHSSPLLTVVDLIDTIKISASPLRRFQPRRRRELCAPTVPYAHDAAVAI